MVAHGSIIAIVVMIYDEIALKAGILIAMNHRHSDCVL